MSKKGILRYAFVIFGSRHFNARDERLEFKVEREGQTIE